MVECTGAVLEAQERGRMSKTASEGDGVMPDTVDEKCPFCAEGSFDLVGLKHHLQMGYCEAFNDTEEVPAFAIKRTDQ